MKTSHVNIIFADISFLLCGVLVIGYMFVEIKQKEPVKVLFEREIDFPTLSGKSEVYSESSSGDSIKIIIPHDGGRYIVEGTPVLRTEIGARLVDVANKSIILQIDPKAPSEDTLYLYSILNELNANVTVQHYLSGRETE
ncbi:MAG: hypothetical protein NUV86_00055 [Candidatus Scalindua sp.]|nr:hypothetical protein [Candidatus Scalindua sp.]MCR4345057.1 hypothetical protein [Candidatus Scalindua sp.]